MSPDHTRPGGEKPNGSARILAGFRHLPGYLDDAAQAALVAAIANVVASAPLYRPTMPRTGKPFSVQMTNCGSLGWVSDKNGGYRYQPTHPVTGAPWPPMPPALIDLWREVADYEALPEACLVNHYEPGSKLGSHVDADEADTTAPVLSISLGCDAIFHVGGLRRADPKTKLLLGSGDVVILGGTARRAYHGIDRILPHISSLIPAAIGGGGGRINLTLRRVTHSSELPSG